MERGLFDRVVTLYHREGGTVTRLVAEGCHYEWKDVWRTDLSGTRQERNFLLVLPGEGWTVTPGDRVFDGVGPEITPSDWAGFVPACVPGLSQVAYVRPCRVNGRVCHVEAGRRDV